MTSEELRCDGGEETEARTAADLRETAADASQESLTTTVEVYKGEESIVLPCRYSKELVEIVTVKWGRCGLSPDTVHQRREGDELHEQNQLFEGRTSMSPFALDTGDFSLTLRKPQLSDSGIYSCSIIDDKQETMLSDVQLQVKEKLPTWAIVLLALLALLSLAGLITWILCCWICTRKR